MRKGISKRLAQISERVAAAKKITDCPSCHGMRPNLSPGWRCETCFGSNRDPDSLEKHMEVWKHALVDLTLLVWIVKEHEAALKEIRKYVTGQHGRNANSATVIAVMVNQILAKTETVVNRS